MQHSPSCWSLFSSSFSVFSFCIFFCLSYFSFSVFTCIFHDFISLWQVKLLFHSLFLPLFFVCYFVCFFLSLFVVSFFLFKYIYISMFLSNSFSFSLFHVSDKVTLCYHGDNVSVRILNFLALVWSRKEFTCFDTETSLKNA